MSPRGIRSFEPATEMTFRSATAAVTIATLMDFTIFSKPWINCGYSAVGGGHRVQRQAPSIAH